MDRAVSHLRREFAAEALAAVRFETPPGRQVQIDFGQRRVAVEGEDPGVQNDACVDVDTNHYSVPWRLIGAEISVAVGGGKVRIHHAGAEVACYDKRLGRRERAVDRAHPHGIVSGGREDGGAAPGPALPSMPLPGTDLLRPWRSTSKPQEGLVSAEVDALPDMLARLKLVAMRDRLDGLLDEAARGDLSLRETLALPGRAEVSHREERRIRMGTGIAEFPHQRTLASARWKGLTSPPSRRWTPSRCATSRPAAGRNCRHVLTIKGDSYRLREKRRSGLVKATPAPAPAGASQ